MQSLRGQMSVLGHDAPSIASRSRPHAPTRRLAVDALAVHPLGHDVRGVHDALPSQTKGEDTQAWVAHLLAGRDASTANRSIIIVRRMMCWASHRDRGLSGETPWHRLEQLPEDRRNASPVIPSPKEIAIAPVAKQVATPRKHPLPHREVQETPVSRRGSFHASPSPDRTLLKKPFGKGFSWRPRAELNCRPTV